MPPSLRITDSAGGGDNPPGGLYSAAWAGFSSRNSNTDEPESRVVNGAETYFAHFLIKGGEHDGEEAPCSIRPMALHLDYWCWNILGQPWEGDADDVVGFEKFLNKHAADKPVQIYVKEDGWVVRAFVPEETYVTKFLRFSTRDPETGTACWIERDPPANSKYKHSGKRKVVMGEMLILDGDYQYKIAPFSCTYAIDYHEPKPGKSGGHDLNKKSYLAAYLQAMGFDEGGFITWMGERDFADNHNIAPELEEYLQTRNTLVMSRVNEKGWIDGDAAMQACPGNLAKRIVAEVTQNPKVAPLFDTARRTTAPAPAPTPAPTPAPAPAAAAPKAPTVSNGKPLLEQAYDAVASLARMRAGKDVEAYTLANGVYTLTPDGVAIAKDVVGPYCDAKGYPRSFARLAQNPAQIQDVIAELGRVGQAEFSKSVEGGDDF